MIQKVGITTLDGTGQTSEAAVRRKLFKCKQQVQSTIVANSPD
jgi:hypothetical protein